MLKPIRDWRWWDKVVTESAKMLSDQAKRLDQEASKQEKEADQYEAGTKPARFAPQLLAAGARDKALSLRQEARQVRGRAESAPRTARREHWLEISGLSKEALETGPRLSDAERSKLVRASKKRPGLVGTVRYKGVRSNVWLLGEASYLADEDLTGDDVMALVSEAANKRRLKLERAHALMAMTANLDAKGKRQPIPQDVKLIVWQRDAGRCVECGSQQDLEYDHIIPLAMGGSNTDRNLQLLCAPCNQRKGASLG